MLTVEDTWWDLRPDTAIDELAGVSLSAVDRAGLPWLGQRSNERRFIDAFAERPEALPLMEVTALERLMQRLGPPNALAGIQVDLRRRDEELRRRRQSE